MPFDTKKFLDNYSIPYATEGKNTSIDFVNIDCPFCPGGDTSNHLGIHISKGFGNCWRCGHKKLVDVIQELIDCSFSNALRIIKEYSTDFVTESLNKNVPKKQNTVLYLPKEAEKLNQKHKKYLEKRNFDPEKLEKEYDLVGTAWIGDYKFRIIAPIYFNNKLVSFQGRDYTNKQELRYMTCPKSEEVIHHKYILYNIDNAKKDKIVLVEGIFDVFRLGRGAVASFGSSWTMPQAKLLSDRFKEVFIYFDNDEESQEKADKLGFILESQGIKCYVINDDFITYKDPGDMKQEEADSFMREVVG